MFYYKNQTDQGDEREGLEREGLQGRDTECQAFFPVVRIGSPPRQPQGSVAPPPFGSEGETHSLAGKGVGGPKSDEGTHSGTCILLSLYGRDWRGRVWTVKGGRKDSILCYVITLFVSDHGDGDLFVFFSWLSIGLVLLLPSAHQSTLLGRTFRLIPCRDWSLEWENRVFLRSGPRGCDVPEAAPVRRSTQKWLWKRYGFESAFG